MSQPRQAHVVSLNPVGGPKLTIGLVLDIYLVIAPKPIIGAT